MPLIDTIAGATDPFRTAGAYVSRALTPTLRLGVTGLSGAGKTVFITALVRNLIAGGRLPFFGPSAEGRILRAYLEPQPDDDVPRFEYEAHLACLGRSPPEWPPGTSRISQLRVTIDYQRTGYLAGALGHGRLHLDIVDYPGEWLIDLPMLEQSYRDWSQSALELAREPGRQAHAQSFLEFADGDGAAAAANDEQAAIEGARRFTTYLQSARRGERLSVLGPGRFLLPGELEGSPLLTFYPMLDPGSSRAPLAGLLARRFESYKARVVRPFFRNHFRRLDRQIVLIDALSALDAGAGHVRDLERAMPAVLAAFRPGANSWLMRLMGRRIDRILFAATKADHLHHTSHDRLEAILRLMIDRAYSRAADAGADVRISALAALRSTREASARSGDGRLPCILGTPMPGEILDGRRFDGTTEVAVFPGDLPADPSAVLADVAGPALATGLSVMRFRPPPIELIRPDGSAEPLPHIRLDRALEFLIADRLT